MSQPTAVRVEPVSSSSDLRELIDLPFRIYANDKDWAPGPRAVVEILHDREVVVEPCRELGLVS